MSLCQTLGGPTQPTHAFRPGGSNVCDIDRTRRSRRRPTVRSAGLDQTKAPEIETYLRLAASRRRLLMNTTILAGTLAAALTAAPALGGKSFADWLTSVFSLSSPAWQLLCGVASLCSVAAAVATQLLKSHNIEERITCAQGARVKIEMLELGIKSGLITPADAAGDYIKCIGDIAFIQGPLRSLGPAEPCDQRPAEVPHCHHRRQQRRGGPAFLLLGVAHPGHREHPRRLPTRVHRQRQRRQCGRGGPLLPRPSQRSGTAARSVERTLDPPRPPGPRP